MLGQACAPQQRMPLAECLRDLDRFLRRDYDDDRQALLLLGKCDVVSNNLLPLLKTYPSDAAMVYAIRAHPARPVALAPCHARRCVCSAPRPRRHPEASQQSLLVGTAQSKCSSS